MKLQLREDGTVRVACDPGHRDRHLHQSAQLASDKVGIPLNRIEVALGDTSFPAGPVSGGSLTTESVIPAVFRAADSAIKSVLTVATAAPGSPFANRKPDDLAFEGGMVFVKGEGRDEGVPFADVLRSGETGAGDRQRQGRGDLRRSQRQALN